SGSRDLLRPVRFKLSYEIIQREPSLPEEGRPLPNIDDYPILDQQEAVKFFEGHFVKDCGSDDVCNSDLHTEAHLRLPYDNSKSHQVFELGLRNMAILETSVTNSGDPAYEPNLYVRHHDSMAFSIKESDVGLDVLYWCVM
ncbi:Integrin alpha-2, partial [Trinorchestia longiramus]